MISPAPYTDQEAERCALACELFTPDSCPSLEPRHFHERRHQVLLQALRDLRAQGVELQAQEAVDLDRCPEPLRFHLSRSGSMPWPVTEAYVVEVGKAVPNAASAEHYEARVLDAHKRRRLQAVAGDRGTDLSVAEAVLAHQEADDAPLLVRQWPAALSDAALIGLSGDVLDVIGPETESDPDALLLQFLVAFGNCVGRGPYMQVEGDRHGLNLFAVMVGQSSKARKGTSWGRVRQLFDLADPEWSERIRPGGLSSGEGLAWAIRDPVTKQEPVKERGVIVDYQTVTTDPGVSDKRLLVVESEFARVLRALQRDGNTLSATLRESWDGRTLSALTKSSPYTASNPHVSVIGHVTSEELLALLSTTDAANGLGNRLLFSCARRARCLPEGGIVPLDRLTALARDLGEAIDFARRVGLVERDDGARRLWHQVYPRLSAGRPGLLGAITGRAEAQVMRLSMVYALLDRSRLVKEWHLRAALEVWRRCEESAAFVFGRALGNEQADRILTHVREHPDGVPRSELRGLFSNHASKAEINAALALLVEQGLVTVEQVKTGGRPRELVRPAGPG